MLERDEIHPHEQWQLVQAYQIHTIAKERLPQLRGRLKDEVLRIHLDLE